MHSEMIERICERADAVTPAPDNESVQIILTLKGREAVAALRWLERQRTKHAKTPPPVEKSGNGHEETQ